MTLEDAAEIAGNVWTAWAVVAVAFVVTVASIETILKFAASDE